MQVVTYLMEQHGSDSEVAHELKVEVSGRNAIESKVYDDFNPGAILLPGAMISANKHAMALTSSGPHLSLFGRHCIGQYDGTETIDVPVR